MTCLLSKNLFIISLSFQISVHMLSMCASNLDPSHINSSPSLILPINLDSRMRNHHLGHESGEPSREVDPPHPPNPPVNPTFADVLAQQTWLLRQLVQSLGNQGPPRREEPQARSYGDFLHTNPPIFHGTEDPFDADYWIGTIKKKAWSHSVRAS